MQHQPIMKRVNGTDGWAHRPYQLLITAACTNTDGKMKGSHSRAADRCPLYLDIAKSGYLFHAVGNVMRRSHYRFILIHIYEKTVFILRKDPAVMITSSGLSNISQGHFSIQIYDSICQHSRCLREWIENILIACSKISQDFVSLTGIKCNLQAEMSPLCRIHEHKHWIFMAESIISDTKWGMGHT